MRPSSHSHRPALDLVEEAVHLLRRAPGSAFAWYYFGAVPFALSLLYFWTDMSWSADARRDCALGAAVVSCVFVWMKFCQAMFAQELRKQVSLDVNRQLTFSDMLRIFAQQTIFQPFKLFVLPLAFVITLPFGWVCAFYENVTVRGAGNSVSDLRNQAWRQATLWPRQNHLGLLIFWLFRIVTAVNLLLVLFITPHLLKMLSGFENIFTRSSVSVLNSTALAVVCAGTYLCCDPFLKAFYVLRCFYGESLESGEDLQVEVRRLRPTPALALIAVVATLFPLGAMVASPTEQQNRPGSIRVEELNRAIDDTMNEPQFRWRMPREEAESDPQAVQDSAIERWLHRVAHNISKGWQSFKRWLDRIERRPSLPEPTGGSTGPASRTALEVCLILFIVALVAMLAWKIRQYLAATRAGPAVTTKSVPVDLTDENVRAEELPEDEWLRLARELMERGELSLALRALFFAGMAHLAHREVIVLARYKSNRDYQLELKRRAPGNSALQNAFAENRIAVERAWYGHHRVDAEMMSQFQSNLARIQAA